MNPRFSCNHSKSWHRRIVLAFMIFAGLAAALAAAIVASNGVEMMKSLFASPISTLLNAVIVGVGLAGVGLILAWLARASREEAAINDFHRIYVEEATRAGRPVGGPMPVAQLGPSVMRERVTLVEELQNSGGVLDPNALSDALHDREQPRQAIARHIASSLVMLGLLGTFVGLLSTIGGVTTVIDALDVSPDSDMAAFLGQLKTGIRKPLDGMAVAFSTSLFGLTGSLFLGFGALGLSAAQASWTGKLDELTILYIAPAVPNAIGAGSGIAPGSTLEAAATKLVTAAHSLQATQSKAVGREEGLERASTRISESITDFRDQVADLATQVKTLQLRLAQMAETRDPTHASMERVGEAVAELSGALTALRSDLRDDRNGLDAKINQSAENLREGVGRALESLAQSVVSATEPAAGATTRALAELQRAIVESASDRQRESRILVDVLARLSRDTGSESARGLRGGTGR